MRILFITAEMTPYSKAGGLADVAGSLPDALSSLVDSMIAITPLYGKIDQTLHKIVPHGISGGVYLDSRLYPYEIFIGERGSGVTVLFIKNDHFYNRPGIYTEANGEGFSDNNERFFFFQLVVMDLMKRGILEVDLVHTNDYHTGLLPVLLKSDFPEVKSIYTIHNFLYPGHFSKDELRLLPREIHEMLTLTQWNNYSALLEGIDHASRVNTVSQGYADELLAGENLDENSHRHVEDAAGKFSGIVNGIDTDYWSPMEDQYLSSHYHAEDLSGKESNKQALIEQCGLNYASDKPLFGSISRLVENKGFYLILDVMEYFVKQGVQFVFLGSGDPNIAKSLEEMTQRYPDQVFFENGFNEPLAHLIEAGSDFFLMPSRFEPCGLNQLYSLRYGTIPIVNRTGGLGETVDDWHPGCGTGIVFEPYDAETLQQAMKRAMDLYYNLEEKRAVIQRAMNEDYSWRVSASKYYELYQLALGDCHEA